MTLTFMAKERTNNMKIISFKNKRDDGQSEFYDVTIQGFGYYDHFYVGKTIVINDKRYKVHALVSKTGLIYKLILHRPKYNLIYNYDPVDFYHVVEIERNSAKQLTIHESNISFSYVFNSPEECLKEFLLLKKLGDYERGYYNGKE